MMQAKRHRLQLDLRRHCADQPLRPWTRITGHGPAWSSSLFEDNAGVRITVSVLR